MGPREEKKAPYNPPNDKPTASCFGPPAIVGRLLTLGWSLLASQQFNSQTDCWSKADEHCYSSTIGSPFGVGIFQQPTTNQAISTIPGLSIVIWVVCTGFVQLYKRPSHVYTHRKCQFEPSISTSRIDFFHLISVVFRGNRVHQNWLKTLENGCFWAFLGLHGHTFDCRRYTNFKHIWVFSSYFDNN